MSTRADKYRASFSLQSSPARHNRIEHDAPQFSQRHHSYTQLDEGEPANLQPSQARGRSPMRRRKYGSVYAVLYRSLLHAQHRSLSIRANPRSSSIDSWHMETTMPRQFGECAPPIRRESMTRLFLKSDAVFKAYEQQQELRVQQQELKGQHGQRHSLRPQFQTSFDGDDKSAKDALGPFRPPPQPAVSQQFKGSGSEPPPPFAASHQHSFPSTSHAISARAQRSSSVQQTQLLLVKPEDGGHRRSSSAMDSIKKEDPEELYKVYKQLGTGRFGFVKLAQHKESGKTVALKFFPRDQTKQNDFLREYNNSKLLSTHPNIIDTFDGIFQASDESAFYFVQEFCPHASLREAVENSNGGIGEEKTKVILLSALNAIEFMHADGFVHRNIKAENILLFDLNDFTKIKVTDFGLTRKESTTVKHLEYNNQYHAPELCDTVVNEMCTVSKSLDIWALGIVIYYCLRGKHPWQKASIMCKPYYEWEQWMKHKLSQLPRRYDLFTEKGIKLQKRCLNPRAKDRWTAKDIRRYLEKEKLLKPVKAITKHVSMDEYVYEENDRRHPNRSGIGFWISNTLSTMAEISEQVVSASNK